MKPPQHIFRQYDIRGIVGEDLDGDEVAADFRKTLLQA